MCITSDLLDASSTRLDWSKRPVIMVMEELHEWTADANKALSVTLGAFLAWLLTALHGRADMVRLDRVADHRCCTLALS
jgi:hypothetical protein